LTITFVLLAILSKPIAVIIPVIFIAYEFCSGPHPRDHPLALARAQLLAAYHSHIYVCWNLRGCWCHLIVSFWTTVPDRSDAWRVADSGFDRAFDSNAGRFTLDLRLVIV
jgi:hypothetical protein